MPAQQGRNPVEYTRSLKQLPPEDLIRLYNDPNDLRPKWAVASAYADAMKARAMQRGMQNQQAMAQNSQEQQQPPVADQVMSVMAANGGEMRAYADGGAIKFSPGGDIPAGLLINPDYDKEGKPRSPAEKDSIMRLNAERIRNYRKQKEDEGKSFFERLSPDEPLRKMYDYFNAPQTERKPILSAVGDFLIDQLSPPAAKQTTPAVPTSGPTEGRPVGRNASPDVVDKAQEKPPTLREEPPRERAAEPAGLGAIDFKGKTPYEQALQAEAEKLVGLTKKRGEVTPEMAAARSRVEQARARQLEQGQQDIGKIREEGIRQLQGRLDRAKMPLIDDAEALLAMAAAINPQKGKVIGSLASGVSNVLADRRARAEKAEEGIFTLNEKIRLLNSQYQEAAALEEQRKYSILTGDIEGQRNAEIEGAKVMMDVRKTQASIRATLEEAEAKKQAAGASRDAASATREANNLNRLTIALQNRQKALQDAKEEWLKGGDIKMAAMTASAPNAKPEDVKKWEDMQRKFETQFRNSQEIRALDNAIAKLSQEAGVAAPVSMGQWGNLQVSEPNK
jgi:hypothetical protein